MVGHDALSAQTGNGLPKITLTLKAAGLNKPMHITHAVSPFGEDDAGNIYLADYSEGTIYKIEVTPQADAPPKKP